MFNKPAVFGRNEPAARRDTAPTLTSTAERSTLRSTGANPATSAPQPAAQPATQPIAPTVAQAPAAIANTSPDDKVGGARLIVGPDVKLKGAQILDCDTLIVEGRVEATMDSRLIRIAENGSFVGTVSIDVAEIHGHFEGELTARSQLIIHSTGRVSGTIRFGKLVVAEGGELNGEIGVISAKSTLPAKSANEAFVALSAAAG